MSNADIAQRDGRIHGFISCTEMNKEQIIRDVWNRFFLNFLFKKTDSVGNEFGSVQKTQFG